MRCQRLLLVATLLGASCSSPSTEPVDRQNIQDPATEVLLREHYSGVDARRRVVLRTHFELDEFFSAVYRNYSPRPAAPTIEFGTHSVVAAAMGTRSSGGYAIDIKGVSVDGTALVVTIEERSPAAMCIVTQALTAPVVLARIARTDQVSFVETTATTACD